MRKDRKEPDRGKTGPGISAQEPDRLALEDHGMGRGMAAKLVKNVRTAWAASVQKR
jgi:hypothetical protein